MPTARTNAVPSRYPPRLCAQSAQVSTAHQFPGRECAVAAKWVRRDGLGPEIRQEDNAPAAQNARTKPTVTGAARSFFKGPATENGVLA
ncbi:hypothetical protein GCM10009825_01700 [Arthrobacter humicola]|uniref:Uncharacterized protein n=1 Tax=Arthrobacter humicola TaxID=409291 RepID=A0ABN2YCL8_9MICC